MRCMSSPVFHLVIEFVPPSSLIRSILELNRPSLSSNLYHYSQLDLLSRMLADIYMDSAKILNDL